MKTLQPAARLGSTKDVVGAVLYLTDAEYTTGVVLAVDGSAAASMW